jgi:hypothetical protein
MATTPTLDLSRDFLAEFDFTRPNDDTGEDEAADGITAMTFRIAGEKGGAALDAPLSLSGQERSATPGRYYAVFDQPDLLTHLAARRAAGVRRRAPGGRSQRAELPVSRETIRVIRNAPLVRRGVGSSRVTAALSLDVGTNDCDYIANFERSLNFESITAIGQV